MDITKKRPLDKAFVADMLGTAVKSYSVSEGARKGDNIVGKMLALDVQLEESTETVHLVIKSLLPYVGEIDAGVIGQACFFHGLQVFPNELIYYQQIRPLLQQMPGHSANLPKFFSGLSDLKEGVNDYITLEDLRPAGYKMLDKKQGMTLEQAKLTLKELCLLHAHSYVFLQSNNQAMEELTTSAILNTHIWSRPLVDMDQSIFFNSLVTAVLEVLEEIGEKELARKSERFSKQAFDIVLKLWRKTSQEERYFKVLVHGDLWVNNILMKEDDNGEPVDVKFIDFQQCRFGNIYEDLHYFIFTSTTAEFRKNHLKTCLQFYFQEFANIINTLNMVPMPEAFTEEALIGTFYENIEYGLAYNLLAIPFQLGEPGPPPAHDEHAPPPPPPQVQKQEPRDLTRGPPAPDALAMVLGAVAMLKIGTKNSPIAIQRLKELMNEMIKLNVIN